MVSPWIPADVPSPPVIPYISPTEYRAAGTAVDTSSLIANGDPDQQTAALANRIAQASSAADQLCFQTLGSTVDIDTSIGLYVRNDGTVRIPVRFWPILKVTDIRVGIDPSSMVALTSFDSVWPAGRRVLSVPVSGLSTAFSSSVIAPPWGPVTPGSRVYTQTTYVNGWPCTTLATSTTVGGTTLKVADVTGFIEGRSYKIHDVTSGAESFTISSISGNTLTLSAGLTYAHTKPTAPDSIIISGMPDSMRAAIVELTSMLIRTRGESAIVMAAVQGEPARTVSAESGAVLNLETAMMLLHEFKRVAAR